MESQKLKDTGTVRLHYFARRGGADTTGWISAASQIGSKTCSIAIEQKFDNQNDTSTLMFQPLPLLEINGLNSTQTGALVRYLASENRWPVPGDDCVFGEARGFARALLPHMPDPKRFVVAS